MRTGFSIGWLALLGVVTKRISASIAVLAPLALAQAAEAQTLVGLPGHGLAATTTGPARSIAGWTEFCRNYAGECVVDRNEPSTVTLTPVIWQSINAINRRVNKALIAVTDLEHWGIADRWDMAEDGRGDCEDFQLRKRSLLAAAGLPRRAMRMTVVIDGKGEGHAVLTIVTNRGDLVLDNKSDAVQPWNQTGYTFVKRESQDTQGWVALGGTTSPVTTANR